MGRRMTFSYLAIISRAHEDINSPNLTLSERNCLKLFLLGFRWVQHDPLLPIDYVLVLLT